jgi:transglutaminase-like putative cysteine protease
MLLPQLFKFLTFLMVLLGTVSLLIFGHLAASPGTGVLILVALFGGLFFWDSGGPTRFWEPTWKTVAVIFVLYVIADIFLQPVTSVGPRVIKHAANLSIFLHLFKIYNRKTARDYKQIYLISFFQFVSCTTLTTSFGFFFLFALYVIVALWTLSLFHIRNQFERHKAYRTLPLAAQPGGSELAGRVGFGRALASAPPLRVRSILGPGYFAATFLLAMAILLTSLGMFFLLPRKGVAGLGQLQRTLSVTGLSGEVNLDRYGRITEDRQIVMEVTLRHMTQVPSKVLWRAGALAYFDGQAWEMSPPGLHMHRRRPIRISDAEALYYRPKYQYVPARYDTMLEDELRSRSELWEQRVSVQPYQAAFLISATNPPVLIESNAPFTEGPMATFRFTGPPTEPVSYTVFSQFAPPSERTLREARLVSDREDFDGTVRRLFLTRVPLSPKSAAVLNDEIKIADYPTPYEKIQAIKHYLEENYTYTFDIEAPAAGVDPIEDFLVNTKRGHCEYFATAMALMLKECDIPARLVYGYMSTPESWNRFFGGSFVIRRCDAHAWVEAALVIDDALQWVPVDPSPREAAMRAPASLLGRLFHGVSKFFEALKARWHESIVAFDSSYQNRIAARIETTLADMRRSAVGNLRAAWDSIRWVWAHLTRTRLTAVLTPLALACLVSAAFLLLLRRARRRVRFRRAYVENQPERQVHTVRFYERMLRALLHHDIVKPAGQTPHEFARGFDAHPELRPVIGGLTELYYAVRFGDSQLTGTQIRWVHEALGTLRRGLSARARAARPNGAKTA